MGSRLEMLLGFGFTRDPFRHCDMETADATRIRQVLSMAVDARAMVSIVGDRGVGKSRAVSKALQKSKAKVVRVLSADKVRISAGDIQEAMILDLSDETPRKTKEVRARQLRRILGEASKRQSVVVVLEEAHRLHSMTLRSIKNLRELDWMGETQLFSVVFIGQSDCVQHAGLAEVRLRTESVHMHGLTTAEVSEYVKSTVGKVFEAEAVEAIVSLQEVRNFLDLQEMLTAVMGIALSDGREKVEFKDVSEFLGKEGKAIARPKAGSGNQALASVLERRRSEKAAKATG